MEKLLKNELGPSRTMKAAIAAGLAFFLAVSVAFCVFLFSATKTTVRGQAIRSLTNICQLNEDAITRAFQSRENLLKTLAVRLEKKRIYDPEDILKELEYFDEAYSCCAMGVLDETNTIYRTNGTAQKVLGENITELIWDSEPHITESYFPSYSDEYMVNLFSQPLFKDGELKCVLFSTYYSKDLAACMNINSLQGKGFTFLMNPQGEVVIFPQQYENEEYSRLMKYVNDNPEIIPQNRGDDHSDYNDSPDTISHKGGDSHFDYNGECYYARFEEIGVNNWYLMTCARENDVFAEARDITRGAYAALGIMWAFIVVCLFVTFYSMHRFQEKLRRNHFYDAQDFYYSKPLSEADHGAFQKDAADSAGSSGQIAVKEDDSVCRSWHNCFSEDFCAALDTTEIPIYIIDPETFKVVYCNEILRRYMRRNPLGEICCKAIRGKDDFCPDCAVLKLLKEGVNETTEYYLPFIDTWILMRVSPLCWRGRTFYKITCGDITKQKKLEEEMRLRNTEYSAVLSQSTAGVLRYDIAEGTAAVNVDGNLNRVEEHMVPDYVHVILNSGIIDPESLPRAKSMYEDIHSGVLSKGYDLHLILESGESSWCHLDYTLIENEEGKPYRAVISFYDNTEQREKELAYQRWNARLNALMSEYTAYMEVNLSQDVIEAEGRHGSWQQDSGGRCFSKSLESMAKMGVFEEDRFSFRKFFHRERLLGQFLAGNKESTLEYRTMLEGSFQWYKAEIQMVSDPVSGDVKASIMISNVDEDMQLQQKLRNEAERDAMTGLYNHGVAETLIRQVMELSTGERCCFLIIDLDDLRDINSTLGHPEGDRALKAIADCMKAQFRKSDIMGRIGGDEFVVLLRDVPEIDRLRSAISSFMRRLNEVKIGPLNDWPVHASIGGTMGTAGADDFETMYRQADLALFYTKAMGKNAFNMYMPELEKREFSYRPRSAARLANMEALESAEIRKLLTAVATYCPMVVSANLTQNTYYMMEYVDYTTRRSKDEGRFDDLIRDGYDASHPEDREDFLACFGRENMLKAYAEGREMVRYVGRQIGDDGVYRKMKTVAVFVKDEETGDICEISFTHVVPSGENRIN